MVFQLHHLQPQPVLLHSRHFLCTPQVVKKISNGTIRLPQITYSDTHNQSVNTCFGTHNRSVNTCFDTHNRSVNTCFGTHNRAREPCLIRQNSRLYSFSRDTSTLSRSHSLGTLLPRGPPSFWAQGAKYAVINAAAKMAREAQHPPCLRAWYIVCMHPFENS